MNMTDIECFFKVAELRSFTKAAEALYISQQAASLRIRHLEETYHVTLFERKPALRLTAHGQMLLDAAKDIIERENRLIEELTISKEEFVGEISIGLPPNRSTAFINEFIPYFSRIYPNMTIKLVEKTSPNLSYSVKQNEIDFALPLISESSEKLDQSYLEILPLETENLYLIISDRLLQQYFPDNYPHCKTDFLQGVSLMDFSALPMFLHPQTSRLHSSIVTLLTQNGTPPFIRIKTSLTSSLISLCAQGYGIFFSTPMLLDYLYGTNNYYRETLNAFPVKEFQGKRQTVLIYHKNKYLTKPLQDSIQIIKQIYNSHSFIMEKFGFINHSTAKRVSDNYPFCQ